MKKVLLVSIFIVLVNIGGYFSIKYYNEQKLKNNYKEIMISIKDKELYKKSGSKYKKIGKISEGITLSLIKTKENYFKLKDSDYYILMDNLKGTKHNTGDNNSNYLVTKSITTKPTKLYVDDNKYIQINDEMTFDLLYIDNDKYYINYLDERYYIKDNYKINVKENIEKLDRLSFISLDKDINNDKVSEILKYLSDKNYYTLTKDDYEKWKIGNADFNNNSLLLIYEGENEEIKNNIISNKLNYVLNSELSNLKIENDIYKMTREDDVYYKYVVKNNTKIDSLENALLGKKDSSSQKIAVLNYHFFYNKGEWCNEEICLDTAIFEEELKYLKDNNYKALTMKEFIAWKNGELALPDKSVLLTVDDGAMGTSKINGYTLIPLLEKYKIHATLFLITGWWDINNYASEYLEVNSHGYDLHKTGECGTYQIKCLNYDELKDDIQKSLDIVKTNDSFCFPFYVYTADSLKILKELDFKVAFIGGNRKTKISDNNYLIPRYVIYDGITLNEFIKMIS